MSAQHKPLTLVTMAGEDGPTDIHVRVVSVEIREKAWLCGPLRGLQAQIHLTDAPEAEPDTLFLSRLEDEVRWTADSHFGPGGHPYYSHGFGARYTIPQVPAPEIAALLDAETVKSGLVAALDQQAPLVLPAEPQH